jgi:hypothetical protein
MKLFAARAEIDADDIILLYRQLGFTTVHAALTPATNTTRQQHGRRGSQCDQIDYFR